MDEFFAHAQKDPTLPVVTEEIGDVWIQGVMTDPRKASLTRRMQRAWEPYADDKTLRQATNMFVKLAEHTWGLAGLYNASYNWSNPWTERMLANGSFDFNLHTWDEQRNFTRIAQHLVPTNHPLKPIWAEILAKPPPTTPSLQGYHVTSERAFSTPLGDASFTASGAVVVRGLKLGEFTYATLSEDVYNLTGPNVCCQVLGGKKGSAKYGGATHRATAKLIELWQASNASSSTTASSFWAKLSIAGEGAPETAWSHFTLTEGNLQAELVVLDKQPTRFNEAGWFSFQRAPTAENKASGEWSMNKLGSRVRFEEVVRGGSPAMHGVDFARWEGRDGSVVTVDAIDTPVLSAIGPKTDPSEAIILVNQQEVLTPELVTGVAFNLWNNAWSTNYMFFYPYHKKDADMGFSFVLNFTTTAR